MIDISKTDISTKLATYQSSYNIITKELPVIFYNLLYRISDTLNISKEHVFMQIINMNSGGYIYPHYDSAIDGYINYKCNISILSDDYQLFIDNEYMNIQEGDLYTFEASLYKHWTNKFINKRILLSYGFIVPYSDLNRSIDDPRIGMSNRIQKYLQK